MAEPLRQCRQARNPSGKSNPHRPVSYTHLDVYKRQLVNLVHAWEHEIKEMMGGMGLNSIEALRGNRLMLRGVGLNEKELDILGIKHAGE